MFSLGNTSRQKLSTVEAPLQRVVERAIQLTKCDFSVLEGARSQQRQWELYAKGRTVAECRAAGVPINILARPGEAKVTWVTHSNHFPDPKTGLGRAVDLVPYPVVWNDRNKFLAMKDAMFAAAKELGVTLRWGGDWDCDGCNCEPGETDIGHFELKRV